MNNEQRKGRQASLNGVLVCCSDFSLKDCISLSFSASHGDVISEEEEWPILSYHLGEYMHPLLAFFFSFCITFKNSPESRGRDLDSGPGNLFRMCRVKEREN